jgi:hypothetical protein
MLLKYTGWWWDLTFKYLKCVDIPKAGDNEPLGRGDTHGNRKTLIEKFF